MLRNVTFAMIVAALTAAGTLTVLYPASLTAEDEVAPALAWAPLSKLDVDGCSVTLEVVAESAKPGQPVQLHLKAVNPTDESVELTVIGGLSYQSPADRMSRRMMPMTPTWTQSCTLTVPPGETVEAVYNTDHLVEAGSTLTPSLQAGDQVVNGQSVFVPFPPAPEAEVEPETSAPSAE